MCAMTAKLAQLWRKTWKLTGGVILACWQALKFGADDAHAYSNLGTALMDASRVPEAIEQFEQALKIRPDFAAAHDKLVKAQALLKSSPPKN